jgi:hypothetical protein
VNLLFTCVADYFAESKYYRRFAALDKSDARASDDQNDRDDYHDKIPRYRSQDIFK